MNRRTFTALTATALSGVAGCSESNTPETTATDSQTQTASDTPTATPAATETATPTPTETATPSAEALAEEYGPWLGEPATVAVLEDSPQLAEDVRDAMQWWGDGEGDAYIGFEPKFQFVDDAEAADIVVSKVDAIGSCGHEPGDFSGCADLLDPDEPAPDSVSVTIESGLHPDIQPFVVRHELGHVLGLPHQLEPGIMQESPEYYLEDIYQRANPWNREELNVFLDLAKYGKSEDRFREQINDALRYYEDPDRNLGYEPSFSFTDSEDDAQIIVRPWQYPGGDYVSKSKSYRSDVDADPEYEWIAYEEIWIAPSLDISAVGFHVAYQMWYGMGDGDHPEELSSETDYHHRRGQWWD